MSLCCSFAFSAAAQRDSLSMAKLYSLLDEYVAAMEDLDTPAKEAECDMIVSSCQDSLLKQDVALRLYSHYISSTLMGEEAVAIHLFDRWFESGEVKFKSGSDFYQARIYATFNRNSLVGLPSPVIEMQDSSGSPITVPGGSGRRTILYFYDISCPKCSMESVLLRYYLDDVDSELDFYALYCGSDAAEWEKYRSERLPQGNSKVRVFHAWDPEGESGFQMQFGVLQTPRLFLLDRDGTIIGRGLDIEALRQMVSEAAADDELTMRNPEGASLPSIKVPGVLKRCGKSSLKTLKLSSLRGSPAYLVFYSQTCSRCAAALDSLDAVLSSNKRSKAFLVDVDELMAENPELMGQLLDSFDLRVLPHVFSLDSRGRITGRYLDLKDGEK